jgi:hypothetical protein
MTVGHDDICREISAELEDMARQLSGGKLSPEQFRLGITRLEQRKLQRFGLKLASSVSPDQVVHFTLSFADTDELCACMDVDPMTGNWPCSAPPDRRRGRFEAGVFNSSRATPILFPRGNRVTKG